MGVVYLALDREHQARVALKTIAKMSAASLLRFKNEFRALADVVHPNLVPLFELMGGRDEWFFTMEHVDGVPFVDFVRPTDDRTLDLARLRAAFPQLVEAVATIHAAGKLHCDLKPSNVLVVPDTGRVVVLDFGLVTEIDAPLWTQSRSISGTVAFMSPEQASGDHLTEASDWYSLGVMLYQALTGRLPLDGPNPRAVLTLKQTYDPPPPQTIDPTLPDDLSALCVELLDRDPRRRPNGRAILARLDKPAAVRHDGTFVGREQQLAQLRAALREVRSGHAHTIYVHGPSGVGKSALTHQFLRDAGDAMVLAGRCYERESVPFKALDSVMDALTARLAAMRDSARFLNDDVAFLARVFPVLMQLPAVPALVARAPVIADLQEVRRRAFSALRELLRRLAGSYLLIVFVDDLQWSDLDSTGLLRAVLAPPNPPRLLFVGNYRSEHADTSAVLKRLLEQDAAADRVEVGLLSDDAATEVARSLLGADVDAATVEAVVREAAGIPLFLEQLAHAVDEEEIGATSAPLSFDATLQRRLSALDASSRRILEHVAAGGQPLPQSAILQAAQVRPEQALRDVALLRAQQWVRTDGMGRNDTIEPFHDRIRESITAALAADVLCERHLALATALEPMDVDPEILAVHWSGARRFDEATRYATLAADRAFQTLAFNRAARLYGLALGWRASSGANAQTLQINLATALAHAGRSTEAGDAYLKAAEGDAADALLYKQRAAEQYLNHGHVEQGYAVLADLLHAVGLRMPSEGTGAVVSLLLERARLRVRRVAVRRRARTVTPEQLAQIDVCLVVGKGLSMLDPIRGASFQTRAVRLALGTGDARRIAVALALQAGLEGAAGHRTRPRVEDLLRQGETLAARLDDVQASASVRFLRGVTHYLRGEWRTSLAHCDEAQALFRERCMNVWWEIDQSASYGVWNLCYLGRLGDAAIRVRPLLEEATERGDRLLVSQLLTGITVLVPLSQGDEPDAVADALVAGVQPWRGQHYTMPHLLLLFGLCQVDLYRGRGTDAWARIGRDWAGVRSSLLLDVEFIRIEFLGLKARCALAAAAAAADPRPLLDEAQRAARALERIGSPWAVAYAQPIRAQLAIAAGADDVAATSLAAAADQFERLDMAMHAAAARYRASAIVGGAEGDTVKAASIERMRALGIINPDAMTAELLPIVERLHTV